MKTMLKTLLSLTLLLAVALCALPVHAEDSLPPLSDLFLYEPGEGEENAETTRAANAAYRETIDALAQKTDVVCESGALRFEALQYLAVDDFTLLVWRVTNLTDKTVFLTASEFYAAFSGIEYDVCGGWQWDSLVLAPGASADARFHGTLWSHFEPGEGEFTLDMKVYEVSQDAEEAAEMAALGTFSPVESGCPLLEETRLAVPMTMRAGNVRSALKDGAPLEWEMDGYTLRVTQAEMSEVGARFALERIYASRDAALADPPDGDTFWDYELLSADGAKWVSTAYGNLPDAPVELEDGRWAWQYSTRVYYMVCQPETVVLRARRSPATATTKAPTRMWNCSFSAGKTKRPGSMPLPGRIFCDSPYRSLTASERASHSS